MSPQELIPLEDAAAEFGVHRTTIFRHITEGRLSRHTRMGDRRTFVDRREVQRLVEDPSVQACLQLVYDRFRARGEWPVARDIQRELDRSPHATFDFLAAIEALPQELGWRVRDMEGRAQLTVRGIARSDNSSEDVNAFLALIRACYERYIGDERLAVTSGQLATEFGFDPLVLERLFLMVQVEAGFWSSLGKTPEGWTVEIDGERIRHFREVRSLSDYVNAKQRAFQPRLGPTLGLTSAFAANARPEAALHPTVAEAVGDLKDTPAVVAAAAALERLMAERLGEDRHGAGLISRYFDTTLRVSPTDARRLEALRALAMAAFGAYRNLAAHGRMDFVGPQAKEIVGLFSLLAREVEGTPMPVTETQRTISWVPFREAEPETLSAFIRGGSRAYGWQVVDPASIPQDWFCDVHDNFIDRDDLGISYRSSADATPACTLEACSGRGWEQVHPQPIVPSLAVGGGGQSPVRAGTRVPKGKRQ